MARAAKAKWIVIITFPDGSKSAAGPFPDGYAATTWGNAHETMESDWVCDPVPLESPEEFTA
jgi:hypothetical protein